MVDAARLLDRIPAGGPLEVRDRAMLELAYACGLRVDEIRGLRVDDVDFYYEEYREHVYAELEEKPWGTREFAVLDPTRNLIWLVERSA